MNLADGLKQLARICGEYSCADCPLRDIPFCAVEIPDRSVDVNKMAAAIIEKWAKENPEPVYPTWGEWFAERGELCKDWKDLRVVSQSGKTCSDIIGLFYNRIPTDIAQKLGLQPKEKIV